jgi:hypothetical protein
MICMHYLYMYVCVCMYVCICTGVFICSMCMYESVYNVAVYYDVDGQTGITVTDAFRIMSHS